MMSRKFRSLVLIALAGLLMTLGAGVHAATRQGEPAGTPIPMTLPRSENPEAAQLKEGEGSDLVLDNCLKCHTLSPIVTHDGFSPEVWASEVEKMRETYGAEITDEDAEGIVAYLSTYYSDDPGSVQDMLLGGIEASLQTPGVQPATPASSPETDQSPSD